MNIRQGIRTWATACMCARGEFRQMIIPDTNVLSALMQNPLDAAVVAWLDFQAVSPMEERFP